jgi:hypothetical protein
MLTWILLAWAWQRLSWRIAPTPLAAVLSAALFVTINEFAHMAGEWVVGGVEAKCFAYGFVLLALRDLIDRRWNRMLLLLGAATAFHPIVGGWSAVVCGCLMLWTIRRPRLVGNVLPGLAGAALLASLGIVPALMLTWNEPEEIVAEASRIYVFERLPHHLAPLTLPTGERARRLGGHAALLAMLWITSRAVRSGSIRSARARLGNTGPAGAPVTQEKWSLKALAEPTAPLTCVVDFAWGAAGLAGIGLAIALFWWNEPLVAARLLRYYWFRLTDFAAPMAVALCLTTLIAAGVAQRRAWGAMLLIAALVLAGGHLANVAGQRMQNPIPPADEKVRDFAAWVEACKWVGKNSPSDALFLTPRLNHTFKWRAGRPEVANRKDIPQDARSIIEWHRRIKEIYYTEVAGLAEPLDSIGVLGTERVRELALKFGADHVLMDRGQLLSLPIAFWNEEYVVYRITPDRN